MVGVPIIIFNNNYYWDPDIFLFIIYYFINLALFMIYILFYTIYYIVYTLLLLYN